MPTYICTTGPGLLGESQRAAIARAITRAHSAATGAPTSFAQVVFEERAHRFIGGEPTDAHVMVRGDIRAGRAPATRTGLAEAIAREVAAIAGVAAHEIWVYLNELSPGDMVEFGQVLPPSARRAPGSRRCPPTCARRWSRSTRRARRISRSRARIRRALQRLMVRSAKRVSNHQATGLVELGLAAGPSFSSHPPGSYRRRHRRRSRPP